MALQIANINRQIIAPDTAPLGMTQLTGAAYYVEDADTVRIVGFDIDEVRKIRVNDAIIVGGDMAIVLEIPTNLAFDNVRIKLHPAARFSTGFTNQDVFWAKGRNHSGYPKKWSLNADEYSVNGVQHSGVLNYCQDQNVVFVTPAVETEEPLVYGTVNVLSGHVHGSVVNILPA